MRLSGARFGGHFELIPTSTAGYGDKPPTPDDPKPRAQGAPPGFLDTLIDRVKDRFPQLPGAHHGPQTAGVNNGLARINTVNYGKLNDPATTQASEAADCFIARCLNANSFHFRYTPQQNSNLRLWPGINPEEPVPTTDPKQP